MRRVSAGASPSPCRACSDGIRGGDEDRGLCGHEARCAWAGEGEDSHAASELHRPLPFEFRVLDAALESVCGRLEAEVTELEAAEAVRAAAHEAVLAEQVEEDDDLQELEDLLETYFAQLDSCSNRLSVLRQVITDTEEYVNVGLDSKRNKILEFNICVGFAVLCHSIASSLYGVFGMNFILCDGAPCDAIPSPFKRSGTWTFKLVSILVAVLAVLLWCAIMFTLRWLGYLHILPGGRRRQPTAHLLEKEERLEVTYEKSFKEFAQQGAGAR